MIWSSVLISDHLNTELELLVKGTSKGDQLVDNTILRQYYAHISATIQLIITTFSAVITY